MDAVMDQVKFQGFEEDAFNTQRSNMFGEISLFAPLGPVEHWGELPWLMTSEKGVGGTDTVGFKHIIKASAIKECWKHYSIVGPEHLWVGPEEMDL
jgi:hypothetical protein